MLTQADWRQEQEQRAALVASLPAQAAGFHGELRHLDGGLSELSLPGHHAFRFLSGGRPSLWNRWMKPSPVVDGLYEPATSFVLSQIVGAASPQLAFDLGATHGYFSALMASHAASATDVIAFDMMPFVTQSLERLRAVNPALAGRRLEGRRVALSEADAGDITVWMHKSKLFEHEPKPAEYREKLTRRLKHAVNGEHWKLKLNRVTLPVRSIDSICDELGDDPDLLKIDVDGYEARILPGAMRMVARRRPWIVMELHRQAYLDRFGVTRADIVGPLLDMGYRAVLVGGRGRLSELTWTPVAAPDLDVLETGETDLIILF
jgi:FkbM family methyltransferase